MVSDKRLVSGVSGQVAATVLRGVAAALGRVTPEPSN
jgi:hypothetical protein